MILPPTATSLTILTSIELAPTPVTVPARCPFKTNDVPIPPIVTPPVSYTHLTLPTNREV